MKGKLKNKNKYDARKLGKESRDFTSQRLRHDNWSLVPVDSEHENSNFVEQHENSQFQNDHVRLLKLKILMRNSNVPISPGQSPAVNMSNTARARHLSPAFFHFRTLNLMIYYSMLLDTTILATANMFCDHHSTTATNRATNIQSITISTI